MLQSLRQEKGCIENRYNLRHERGSYLTTNSPFSFRFQITIS